jgi:hypothetical protein
VLTQKHGGQHQPVAFLSKFLEPVTRGWSECIQAVAAIALNWRKQKNHLWGKSSYQHFPSSWNNLKPKGG